MKESKPKYLEIADVIHQEIREEIYKQGDKLPVERELQERFGASRMTIRHALQKLEQQGVVRIDRGRGAFVMDLMIQRSKEILGVTELMERKGLKCHSKVLHLEKIKPDEHTREAMNLTEEDEVYFLHRIRYANDEAIAVEYAHINAKYCPGLEMFNFESFFYMMCSMSIIIWIYPGQEMIYALTTYAERMPIFFCRRNQALRSLYTIRPMI